MVRFALILTSVVWLLLPAAARAADTELEKVVDELKARVAELEDRQEADSDDASAGWSESAAPAWIPTMDFGEGTPTLSLRGFGNAQYDVSHSDPDMGSSDTTNHFGLGELDLFITSRISEDFSFLNETVFEFDEEGENTLDVERVLLKYAPTDWFEGAIGRGHTPLGYWNETFHHGVWLQTTTDRPLIYAFEDDGGILPIHFVGIKASGGVRTDPALFSYNAVIANGRGRIPDSVQLVEDLNDQKAYSLMLRMEPTALPGFGFGVSGYYDKIPENQKANPPRNQDMHEVIAGAHMFYFADPIEFLAEGLWIVHRDKEANDTLVSYGGYAQLAYSFGKFKPYYRFDWLEIDEDDPFYFEDAPAAPGTLLDGVEDQTQHTVGVRWDIQTFVALKLEYRYRDADSEDVNEATAQFSFAF